MRVVDTRTGAQTAVNKFQERFVSLAAARENLRERISKLGGWKPAERDALASAALPLLKTNVTYDRAATEAAREAAAQTVQPTVVVLKRNQTIARAGDTVTPQMLAQFAALRDYSHTERKPQHFIGLFLLACALYFAAWRFTEYRSTITSLPLSHARAFTLVGLSVLVQLVLTRAGLFVAESIASHSGRAPMNDVTIWGFAIPFAAAALLVATLVDTQLALITAVLSAIFAGLLAPGGTLVVDDVTPGRPLDGDPVRGFWLRHPDLAAVERERAREPFTTSGRLVALLYDAIPAPARRTGGHPAKRTFQALRMEVNDELAVLRRALPAAVDAIRVGGRVVVESYHSLEDRLVKQTFAAATRSDVPVDLPFVPAGHEPALRLVTRGAEKADEQEIRDNPRAASVRLRAIERVRGVAS
jgi:hypothetical protein